MSNMGFFVVCIALILTAFTKWHKSLHLDELPEYKRSVLEVMRQPLEASPNITMNHLREAISSRELDKEEQWL